MSSFTIIKTLIINWVILIISIGTLFVNSTLFVDFQLIPKWVILIGGILFLGFYLLLEFVYSKDRRVNIEKRYFVKRIIVFATMIQALYGICQFFYILPSTSSFHVSGSFNNPAGFACTLCASFPIYISILEKKNRKLRWMAIVMILILVGAVGMSGSRTGILCLLIVSLVWWAKYINFKMKWVLFLTVVVMMAIVLYFVNRQSVEGRLLIWMCSLMMMKEHLLFGYGIGGFEKHYMNFQANYFQINKNSSYQMLADNVQYPFCEYIRLITDYGLIGFLIFLLLIVYMVSCYLRYPTIKNKSALFCWFSVGIFAISSYPLMYPFIWLLLLYSGFLLMRNDIYKFRLYLSIKQRIIIVIPFLFQLVFIGIITVQQTKAELEWKKLIGIFSLERRTEKILGYINIYPHLKYNRYFLYNYGRELYSIGEYQKSLDIVLQCRNQWADYEVEVLLGMLYSQLSQPIEAEKHFQLASFMCPNRFIPLYQLVILLKQNNRESEAKTIARQIVYKQVKVPSNIVSQIKKQMQEYLSDK